MNHHNLWAPWRIAYIKGLDTPSPTPDEQTDGCFLCDAAHDQHTDEQLAERLVLVHDERGLLLLNRYPYTNGHLLAAPAAALARPR